MTTPFDALDARLSAAIGASFGEAAIITPRISAEYAGYIADPDRAAMAVQVVFSAGPINQRLGGIARGDLTGQTKFQSQTALIWISAAILAGLPYEIRQGDAVALVGRPGQRFRIAAPMATDLNDIEFMLTAEDDQ